MVSSKTVLYAFKEGYKIKRGYKFKKNVQFFKKERKRQKMSDFGPKYLDHP